jgi:signal transduction histidine kinase
MPGSTSEPSFSELLAAELHILKQAGEPRSVRAGEVIFTEGDPGNGMYVIEQGRVEIAARVNDDERRVLARLEPGAIFGEMAVLDGQPRSATATAETDSRLTFLPREAVLRAIEQSPAMLITLVRELSQRVRHVDRRYLDEILQAERLSLVGRFAQGIVHDFKNPLNIIGMAAELLSDDECPAESRHEAIALVRKQVERLLGMSNELLEFTRGSHVSTTLAEADFGEFVEEVFAGMRPEADKRSVKIECESAPPAIPLRLDRGRLLHVFYNLFNNAMDFMPDGGKITLRFSVTERDVATEVEDTGPGISPEISARLFEPFATHGKAHGTGLGLSICKRIVEDHRGRIGVRSEPGRGAIFCITLPRPADSPAGPS